MSSKRRLVLRSLVSSLFFLTMPGSRAQIPSGGAQKPVLSILSLTSKLQNHVLEKFEREKNALVRVEFVGSSKEFEPRIRATPRAWDLILCDERHLRRLVLARVLKPLPQAEALQKMRGNKLLEQPSKMSEDGLMYMVFMADPLGLVWRSSTRGVSDPVEWDWLSDTQKNPLWRGRLYLPSALDFQYLIALKAMRQNVHEPKDLLATTNWLRGVRSHISNGSETVEMRYLSSEIVASVLWRSEFLSLRKVVPNLEFGIPQSGTYFERYGFGFVGEVQNEKLAADFLNFVGGHQAEFANAVDLVSLKSDSEAGSPTANWALIEDEIPFPQPVVAEIKKLSGAL